MRVVYIRFLHSEKTTNASARDVEKCVGKSINYKRNRRASPTSASSSAYINVASEVESNHWAFTPQQF